MEGNYHCYFCNREHVKLWRPYSDVRPLICATCAEERQSTIEYVERDSNNKAIGKKILPRWTVNSEGKVPGYDGSDYMVDNLNIDLVDENGKRFREAMFPAITDRAGNFYKRNYDVPKDMYKKWEELPTR